VTCGSPVSSEVSRRIGIIVEGPSDKSVVETILAPTRITLLVRIAGGSRILTTSGWIAAKLFEDGAESVVVLKDSDCHAEHALEEYLSAPVKKVPSPEKYCLPDDELNQLFRRIKGRGYVKRRDAPGIASLMNVDLVRDRCPSFATFLDSLGLT